MTARTWTGWACVLPHGAIVRETASNDAAGAWRLLRNCTGISMREREAARIARVELREVAQPVVSSDRLAPSENPGIGY